MFVPEQAAKFSQQFDLSHLVENELTGFSSERIPYRVYDSDGSYIAGGTTDDAGLTERIFSETQKDLTVFFDDGEWSVEQRTEEFEIQADGVAE